MDGKKRIARLRNAEKWKRLWGIVPQKPKPKKISPDRPMVVKVVVEQGCERTWDNWRGEYVERAKGTFGSGANFIAALKKRGYQELGRGAYSTILAKPGSDRVIKVTRNSQDNWIDYIQWAAEKGYCGNFAPRVYSWKKFDKQQVFSVSIVERMKQECRYSTRDSDYGLVESLIHPALAYKNTMAEVYLDDLLPGSLKFFKELTQKFNANDLYGKNMMIRHDGSFCVTDPVCGRSEVKANRLRSKDFTSLAPALWRFSESSY